MSLVLIFHKNVQFGQFWCQNAPYDLPPSFKTTLTLVLPNGGLYPTPLTVLALGAQNRTAKGVKLLRVPSSSSFSFIFSEKIPNLPPTPGAG